MDTQSVPDFEAELRFRDHFRRQCYGNGCRHWADATRRYHDLCAGSLIRPREIGEISELKETCKHKSDRKGASLWQLSRRRLKSNGVESLFGTRFAMWVEFTNAWSPVS